MDDGDDDTQSFILSIVCFMLPQLLLPYMNQLKWSGSCEVRRYRQFGLANSVAYRGGVWGGGSKSLPPRNF